MNSKEINLFVDLQISKEREMLIYQYIGRFGDRIPKDVLLQMKQQADKETKKIDNLLMKISRRLK